LLAEEFVRFGHDVVVIATAPRTEATAFEMSGVRVREVGLRNIYWPYGPAGAPPFMKPIWHTLDLWNPAMASRVGAILGEEKPDVVNTHGIVGFSSLVWREAKRLDIPLVHTLHDHRLLCVRATMFKRGRTCESLCTTCRATSIVKCSPASEVDRVVAFSDAVMRAHTSRGVFDQMASDVLPLPIRWEPPRSRARSSERLELGFLGRLDPVKGVERLLEETRGLPDEGWRLRIAGSGTDRYVKRLSGLSRHPNVSFVGRVEPTGFLSTVDVLIVPSRGREGAGLVVAEAYAQGVPVIAARRGGLPEMVQEGVTGWLFEPDARDELARVLSDLIEDPDPLTEMRAACIVRGEQHRSDVVARGLIRSYRRVIESST
jgi:glycosyltransferase involved in cell wall biosynthesis